MLTIGFPHKGNLVQARSKQHNMVQGLAFDDSRRVQIEFGLLFMAAKAVHHTPQVLRVEGV